MVKYEVQIKPIHPLIKNRVVTNESEEKYSPIVYNRSDRPFESQDKCVDMIFGYHKTQIQSIAGYEYYSDTFTRIEGNFWQVYETTNSLKEATVIARKLIKEIGLNHVKIAKITPISNEIVFSEND